jgi:Family of unknown function (DUF6241)
MTWIKENKLFVTSIIVFAGFLVFLAILFVDMIDKKVVSSEPVVAKEATTSTESQNSEPQEKTEASEVSEAQEVAVSTPTENPFGGQNTTLTEEEILNFMHGMSHQKVIAEEKWIYYEITNDRIQFLLHVVKNGNYENSDDYVDILNRWAKEDFSDADKDHNRIWDLQGGTVGKATGVMSPKEEQEYLEKYKGSIK